MKYAIEMYPFHAEFRTALFPLLRRLSPEQLEHKPEGLNSIGNLLRHVAQSEDWLVNAILRQGTFAPRRKAELADAAAIIDYLQTTRAETLRELQAWPVERLGETRPMQEGFRGSWKDEVTVHWLFNRIFLHETYHMAQCNVIFRLQGLEAPVV